MTKFTTEQPLVTIITVVLNGEKTIRDTIGSVLSQCYPNIEYLVIDGASSDATVEIIKSYGERIGGWVSEADDNLYHAINKGIAMARGEIIGLLHSDDFYIDNQVVGKVVEQFLVSAADAVFGDLLYVDRINTSRVLRYFSLRNFTVEKMRYGLMPAHTAFFVKKNLYHRYGVYRTDYRIAADFELILRFLYVHRICYSYLPRVLVKMRIGGISSGGFRVRWWCSVELMQALREHGVAVNHLTLLKRYPQKLKEVILGLTYR